MVTVDFPSAALQGCEELDNMAFVVHYGVDAHVFVIKIQEIGDDWDYWADSTTVSGVSCIWGDIWISWGEPIM